MYAVDGGRDLPERELPHLSGYESSRPVRVGNGAVTQKQTDVLGEVMIALELARELGVPMPITLALDGVLNRGAPLDAAMAAMLAAAGY